MPSSSHSQSPPKLLCLVLPKTTPRYLSIYQLRVYSSVGCKQCIIPRTLLVPQMSSLSPLQRQFRKTFGSPPITISLLIPNPPISTIHPSNHLKSIFKYPFSIYNYYSYIPSLLYKYIIKIFNYYKIIILQPY